MECYTELEQTIQVLVVNFYKYILKQIKSSFQKILQKELNYMLSNIGSKKAADEFIQDLGANYDGTLTVINALIGRITKPAEQLLVKHPCCRRYCAGEMNVKTFANSLQCSKADAFYLLAT
uniref:Uncharacterized protein n=1 Tax=Sarcophilus harrisii TaxID=9305 RepID=A0A7N4PC98_SARHA